ncbi:aldehyde dehydrogenase family protein [Vreelandella maris]|uniref:Aldehyde dehydrogenase family protein n=1 Tax=Vreelandella maris TaxID=2729617 RepID=A0A7Y6REY6_9GAMM|nr:aldehyde dehydrogenase family protein [Halomonas maris]NVF15797.1 aldehyde dehydrogenase family protein [Halomonas maris]|tara:strand:+ start:6480 stop:7910 length:1431 start_codon:yes stop_codon:yes gene_type:complete
MSNKFQDCSQLLIDGEWVETSDRFPVENKYSGDVVANVCSATSELVDMAIDRAKNALMNSVPAPHERASILRGAAILLEENRSRFIELMVIEAGFTNTDAASEVMRAGLTLQLSADVAATLCGHSVPFGAHPGSEQRIGFTVHDPIGVVCAITPFNSPLNTVLHKVAPSFAAGNPTVLKPSPLTPLTSALLGKILLQAGMPKGYLHIVQGDQHVAERLLTNPDIAFFTFTGSTRVGRIIQGHVGLRRSQMELGSIASTILCADADLDRALPKIANAGFRKAGQVCTSVQRLYVSREVLADVVQRLTVLAQEMVAGDPRNEETRVGPMISEASAERVNDWICEAVSAGAVLHCGGQRNGRLVHPAVLTGVPFEADVWCSEVFGPVISVCPFDTLDEAIKAANDTEFGLAAGIFTRDLDNVRAAMSGLKFGTVQINETSSARADVMPFGGVKASGFGKEGPAYAAKEMTVERLIVLNP